MHIIWVMKNLPCQQPFYPPSNSMPHLGSNKCNQFMHIIWGLILLPIKFYPVWLYILLWTSFEDTFEINSGENIPCQQTISLSIPHQILSHVWGQTNAVSVTIHPLINAHHLATHLKFNPWHSIPCLQRHGTQIKPTSFYGFLGLECKLNHLKRK